MGLYQQCQSWQVIINSIGSGSTTAEIMGVASCTASLTCFAGSSASLNGASSPQPLVGCGKTKSLPGSMSFVPVFIKVCTAGL